MSTGAKPKSVKKKVHNVPSRYLQAAENISHRERSSSKKSVEISQSSQDNSCSSKLGTSSQNNKGMTSTPAIKGKHNFPLLDASVITAASQSALIVPSMKERIAPRSPKATKRNLALTMQKMSNVTISQRPVVASHKKKNSFDEKLASAEMDILYAQYLQSAFLESEAKKALEARSIAAIEKLHKLLTLVQQHLDKAKSKKVSLTVMSTVIKIHEHCQKQHEMLKPVFQVVPTLEEQYKCLANAINFTKHKLRVKDVILTDSDEVKENLQKMSDFISAFFKELPSFKDFTLSSDVLKKYVDFGEHITNELKRGIDLLTKAEELYISEATFALGCKNV